MAYATTADVLALISRIYADSGGFTTGTAPTAAQVALIQPMITAEIDVYLASFGYATPVTTPATVVTYLGNIEACGIAARVLKSHAPESIQSDSGGPVIPAYAFYEKTYRDALRDLESGVLRLAGVSLDRGLARSYLTDYPDNDPSTDGSTDGQRPLAAMGELAKDF